jgi:hypothetical protein
MTGDTPVRVPRTPPSDSLLVVHDLGAVEPGLPRAPEVLGLFYADAVNIVAGDPGGGKTFLALGAVVDVLARGGQAVFVDLEDKAQTISDRLRGLGVDRSILTESVLYVHGLGALGPSDVDWLPRWVAQCGGLVLLVIDSLSEALAMAGLDEDRAPDVTRWFQTVGRPLAASGAAVLIIDHLAKAQGGSGGRWPRGSGHKLAAVDGLAVVLDPIQPFSRERSGSGQLIVAKDRQGAVGGRNDTVAQVIFEVVGGTCVAVRVLRTSPVEHGEELAAPSILHRSDRGADR